MAESPTRILLIRHGMNDYIVQRRLAGWTPGVHLNAEGRAQADALAARLASAGIAALYTSPLTRAIETAEPLAARLALPLRIVEGLGETRCGEWTGQAIEELSKTDLWRQVQVYPSGFRFPGGESMVEVQARMVAALDGLRDAHPGLTIAVFSHSDPIKLAVAFYVGMPLDAFQRLVVTPASITELEFTPFRPRLVRLNEGGPLPTASAAAEPERKA